MICKYMYGHVGLLQAQCLDVSSASWCSKQSQNVHAIAARPFTQLLLG